jgi:ribosome-binding protein aMBF1 (putative translation factor)
MTGVTTTWREARDEALAAMTPAERVAYDAAADEEELRLRLAELVYAARTGAGLTQTELARRVGTSQAVVSAIENGVQVPTVTMLWRISRGLGRTLRIDIAA